MLSARAIGSIIGKGGERAKLIRANHLDCRCNIDGDNCPERIITVTAPSVDLVVSIVGQICDNIFDDFGKEPQNKRPPRIMGRGQKRCADNEIQLCMILNEQDCVAVIGESGERIREYVAETGCQVYIHNDYHHGGEYLPDSNEKILTITGDSSSIPICVEKIVQNLINEGGSYRGNAKAWNMVETGPCGFFGNMATWKGSGMDELSRAGMAMNSQNCGYQSGQGKMMSQPIPGVDPIIQKLEETKNSDGSISLFVNIDQCGCIMGNGGHRIKEIRKMSGALIRVTDPDYDHCLREINIAQGNASDCAVINAIWLINISINAFVEVNSSLCAWKSDTSLNEVVMSGSFGQPPGISQNQPNVNNQGPPQATPGWGTVGQTNIPNFGANGNCAGGW